MKAKRLLTVLLVFYLATSGIISAYYWYNVKNYVKTENAHVLVNVSVVKAPIAGRIVQLKIRESQDVEKNEIIGFLKPSPAYSRKEALVPILASVHGQIIRIGVHEGEFVAAGENLLGIADLKTAYVEARLTETEVSRVHVGQTVDVHLDAQGDKSFSGIVSHVGRSTIKSTFPAYSLVPLQEQPKEEELIPVKIKVRDAALIPGTSASVTIKVMGDGDGIF